MTELRQMTPTTPLDPGETVRHSFHADRATYVRDMTWLAAIAMGLGMLVLWFLGSPYIWTGAVGGLAAIALRAFYVASDELSARWDLTETRLLGPQTTVIDLARIDKLRSLGSAVQIVTNSGDKYLLKYQADKADTVRRLNAARTGGGA